jgi:hypothetical protein
MLLSLESVVVVGAFVVNVAGATQAFRNRSGTQAGRGRRTCANGNWGSPGTWEILSSPWKKSRKGIPGDQPQARRCRMQQRRERKMRDPMAPPSEGNETWRDGRQEVAVP